MTARLDVAALAATFPARDYTTTVDRDGYDLPRPVPMLCADCDRPAYYGPDEAYHHAVDPETGCFLIGPESTPATTVRLGVRFYDDHVNRGLPAGLERARTSTSVVVTLTDNELAELRSDAAYYAEAGTAVFGRSFAGLVASARATVRAIDNTVAAVVAGLGDQTPPPTQGFAGVSS